MDQEPIPIKRRGRPPKSDIASRAQKQMQLAALEARKIATMEVVIDVVEGVQSTCDKILAMLKQEGFKGIAAVSHARVKEPEPASPPAKPRIMCAWGDGPGTIKQTLPNGKTQWLCAIHAKFVGESEGEEAIGLLGGSAPMVERPPLQMKPKQIIHPTTQDILSGRAPANGTPAVTVLDDPE